MEEDEDLRELFQAQMERAMKRTKDDIEKRERLMKIKLSEEIKQSANNIIANHLRDKNSLPEISEAEYAIARAVQIKLEIKRPLRKEKKTKENSRVRKKKKKHIKELRELVAREGNDIYRRKHWRKTTLKEKRITEEPKRKANSNLNKLKDLIIVKEIWLDKLMRKIVKRERQKERNKAMKNNSISQKNEGNAYTEKNEGSKYKGQVTTMNKFVKFWAGILKDESEYQ